MNQWILLMLGTVINCDRGFMHIKNTLALCQNTVCTVCLFCNNLCIYCDNSHMNSWMLLLFCIMTIYHKSLMHVRYKFTLCQNKVHWAIFAVLNSLVLTIPTHLKSCGNMLLSKLVISPPRNSWIKEYRTGPSPLFWMFICLSLHIPPWWLAGYSSYRYFVL